MPSTPTSKNARSDEGVLSEGVLPGVLRDVYVGRRSGRLHFSRGDQRYSVRFVKGDIVHCESSVPQAHLGQIMVSLGSTKPRGPGRARSWTAPASGWAKRCWAWARSTRGACY